MSSTTTTSQKHPYAIDYQSDAAGRHIKASKRRVLFRFGFSHDGHGRTANLDDEHVVTLSWSPTSGKVVLAADGREIHMTGSGGGNTGDGSSSTNSKKRLLIGSKFEHQWEMAGRTPAAAAGTSSRNGQASGARAPQDANVWTSKSISELKSIASQKQIDLAGCLEKSDIVARLSSAAEETAIPTHRMRIVAHATKPLGKKGSTRQFDLFVDGTSYFDLPRCHQLDDGRMGIVGLGAVDGDQDKGEASATDIASEPPSPGVKGALSQLERGDLQKLLGRIEERKRRGSSSSVGKSYGSGGGSKVQSGSVDAAPDHSKTNTMTAPSNDNAEDRTARQPSSAEKEIEQLQNRLADLSYLPFLEMIAKDDNVDVVRRGEAIAEGEIQRNRKRIAELETIAMGGVAEDARDHQMAVQEIDMLRNRIADLEKLVGGEEEAAGGSECGDESTPTSNRSARMASLLLPEDQRHLSGELDDDQEGAEEPDNEASFLSFLSMMGEQEEEIIRREREAAEEKADRLKVLIGNLESLADDSSD